MNEKINRDAIFEIIALSPMQAGILFHLLDDESSGAYSERVCIEFKGAISAALFKECWKSLVQSHDILRTVFRWEKLSSPVQIVLKEVDIPIEIVSEEQFSVEKEYEMLSKKIDIQKNPFRLLLIMGKAKHKLWIIYSHIILDGWSVSLLIKDFFARYRDVTAKDQKAYKEKPSFKTYIKYITETPNELQRKYWLLKLAESPLAPFILPDHVERIRETNFQWIQKELTSLMREKLYDFAKLAEVSVSTVLYACWSILLQRYSNSRDVVFGIVLSQRYLPIAGIEEMAGLLINTIPMRVRCDSDEPLNDFLRQVQNFLIESQENSLLPLQEIKKMRGISANSELFDSLFVVENYPIYKGDESPSDLTISTFSNQEFTHYPLTIIADLLSSANIKVSYDSSLFSEVYIEQIIDNYFHILSTVLINPQIKMVDLQLISKDKAAFLADKFNQTDREYPKQMSIVDLFRAELDKNRSQLAVVHESRHLSYHDLNELSDKLAEQLVATGIEKEEKIGVMLSKGIPMIVALLGILKAGGAYVSINPKLPEARKNYIIQDCEIRYLIEPSDDVFLPKMTQRPRVSSHISGNNSSKLCYVLYSSGSTGDPKGILIEQQGIIRLVRNSEIIQFFPHDRILSTCPLDFDVSALEIWGALLNGSTLYLVDDSHLLMPDIMKNRLREYKINKLWLSTPLFNAWVNEDIALFEEFESVIIGGDALSPAHVERIKNAYPRIKLINGYGPTENSVLSTSYEIPEGKYLRIPIGKPLANSSAYIVNLDGMIQPIGAIGEIWLGGDGVARGYNNRPELTREKFISNPFGAGRLFKSGDIGRWLPDGTIDFLGRNDFQVKVRGYRIEIPEVEIAIKAHPAIAEAVVLVTESGHTEKELTAFIKRKYDVDLHELKSFIAKSLPAYCIPAEFMVIDAFPLTISGKIDRGKLKELKNQSSAATVNIDSSDHETALEEVLQKIYCKVLQKPSINVHENFFDAGGNSLHSIQVRSLIQKELKKQISITDIFQFPTIASLAKHIKAIDDTSAPVEKSSLPNSKEEIAIIGMSGRFPGAQSIGQFWQNLKEKKDSVQGFSLRELLESGISNELIQNPRFMPFKGALSDIEHFDHEFFGYTEREAELMDPQLRLLHECCWEVLEDAGYIPENFEGKIGLFIGSEVNIFWVDSLLSHLQEPTELWQAAHYNAHSITTPVSYKLKLTGPSLTIDTACSSSLVAIHQAKLSLLAGECDLAIAGGVSIELPKKGGYLYEEGMIRSIDGKCRAFDKDATGTVSGDGIGLILLRPLSQALNNKDRIYATIKGSSINNDGARKVGYTAPSIPGQVEVIKSCLDDALVSPEEIAYIETHGTATSLGDPIEIKALSQAYKSQKRHSIAIGSIKTNIGHLNTAAGVAGLIKTALALYYQFIPASLHFKEANPECEFEKTPFFVPADGLKWQSDKRRHAAVSSFGIGGTNAHAILAESPVRVFLDNESKDPLQLVLLSANSKKSLEEYKRQLQSFFNNESVSFQDAAYALQTARKHFQYRSAIICSNSKEACEFLSDKAASCSPIRSQTPKLAFVFPGQGASASHALPWHYQRFPIVTKWVDRAIGHIESKYAIDFCPFLFSAASQKIGDPLNETQCSQLKTFISSFALASLVEDLGVHPDAMVGHSLGEYTSACLANVFSFEQGIDLLMERGRLMGLLPKGKMLATRGNQAAILDIISNLPTLTIAAVNGPEDIILSGKGEEIDRFAQKAKELQMPCFFLDVQHAFHSQDMHLIKDGLFKLFEAYSFNKPNRPYYSCFTGQRIDPAEVLTATYWVNQACQAVQFQKTIHEMQREGVQLFCEIGATKQLTPLIQKLLDLKKSAGAISCVSHVSEKRTELESFLSFLKELWLNGINLDWKKLHRTEMKKVSLPSYCFDRKKFWKYGTSKPSGNHSKVTAFAPKQEYKTFVPQWVPLPISPITHESLLPACYWIFHQGTQFDLSVVNHLEAKGKIAAFNLNDPETVSDLRSLCTFQLKQDKLSHLVYLCEPNLEMSTADLIQKRLNQHFHPLLEIVQSLEPALSSAEINISLICPRSDANEDPVLSMISAFLRTLQSEFPTTQARTIGIDPSDRSLELLSQILSNTLQIEHPLASAFKIHSNGDVAGLIYTEPSDQLFFNESFKFQGVYLITGGLGGIGLVIAEYLATHYQARLILISRSEIAKDNQTDLDKLKRIKKLAKSVEIQLFDVGEETVTLGFISEIYQKYHAIDGVIHLAGIADEGLIKTKKYNDFHTVFHPKVNGALHLIKGLSLSGHMPDFVIFGSSLAAARGDYGQSAYSMANQFLNAYAVKCRRDLSIPAISINWDTWAESGMARKYYDSINPRLNLSDRAILHRVRLSPENDWVLSEHLLEGNPVLPGAHYISILLSKLKQLNIALPVTIASIQFLKPLIVERDSAADLYVSFEPDLNDKKSYQFTFFTLQNHIRQVTCEGKMIAKASDRTETCVKEVSSALTNTISFTHGKSLKEKNRHMQFGTRWSNIREVSYSSRGIGSAILMLSDDCKDELQQSVAHTALLDNAASFLLDLLYPNLRVIPFAYSNLKVYSPFTSKIYSYAKCVTDDIEFSDAIEFELAIYDSEQKLCLECTVAYKKVARQEQENDTLKLGAAGDLSTLKFEPIERSILQDDEVEIETVATGLNFKEALFSLGFLPHLPDFTFGLEACGIITKIGSQVQQFSPGDSVVGMVRNGFNRYVIAKASNLMLKPKGITFEEAAAVPVAYLTAYHALVVKGGLKKGESVLIHSAAGGVGLAAIEIAKHIGAAIYATAGTEEKRSFLKKIGVQHVFNSRTIDFSKEIKAMTQNKGVDVVLNSTTGPLLKASLELVAPHGRFLELGARDILENTPLDMGIFHKGISFISISISPEMPSYNESIRTVFNNLSENKWSLSPIKLYSREDLIEAFKHMTSGQHIGKLVVAHRSLQKLQMLNDTTLKADSPSKFLSNQEGLSSFIDSVSLMSGGDSNAEIYITKWDGIFKDKKKSSLVPQQAHFRKRTLKHVPFAVPATEDQRRLITLFEEYLGSESIGIDDNFSDLGLSSLDIIQIKSVILKTMAIEIPIAQFYSLPTIRKLSSFIGERKENIETVAR